MGPSERIDPRCVRSRHRMLAAAVQLLREDGLHGLTYEAVAARSGVAKTTVYRHFPDREALHLAAIESVGPKVGMVDSGDLIPDVSAFLIELNETLHDGDFGSVLLSALDGAERSEGLATLARVTAAQRRSVLVARLREAQRSGGLEADVDVELLCAALVGPLFYRRFFSRQTTPAAFVTALAESVLVPYSRVVRLRS